VIKQRLQLCKNLSARDCVKEIIRDEGFKGLYRSYPVTIMMNIPYMCIVVSVNENLKTYFQPWNKKHPTYWYFLCAGFAGGLAGAITNPFDVIKTRLQT
jgi:solute carrier family 25 iron transporter 28/37